MQKSDDRSGAKKAAEPAHKKTRTSQPEKPIKRPVSRADKLLEELRQRQIGLESQNGELRRAQVQLTDMHHKYLDLYNFSPVGYFTFDKEGRVRDVNLAGAKLLGMAQRQLVGKSFMSSVQPADRKVFATHCRKVFDTGQRDSCEVRLLRNDGTWLHALIQSAFPLGEGGTSSLCLSAVSDISARRVAEDALRRSEDRYRALAENSLLPTAIIRDQKLQFVSPSVSEVVGYFREDLLALSAEKLAALIHPEDRSKVLKYLSDKLQGRPAPMRYDLRVLHKDGGIRWIEVAPGLVNYDGKPALQSPIVDITERKRAEEALETSRKELEERVKERTKELVDSREQLRSLHTHLQSLRELERTNIAREIHDELGQALTALKMDLIWIAGRLPDDNGGLKKKLNADIDQVNLTIQAVRRVCSALRPEILDHLGLAAALEWQCEEFQRRTGIRCQIAFDPEDVTVDAQLMTPLFRIFQEALTNILRHAKASTIKASLKLTDSRVTLKVSDNGIGITKKQISKPGAFGLVGMRERVYPWGGTVTVRGAKNRGTTLEISVPVTSV